jgi:hypothetical protein
MLEIGAQLAPISVLDSERRQDCRYGLEHHSVDIFVMKPPLFGQCLSNYRPDIIVTRFVHRLLIPRGHRLMIPCGHLLMIRATFSNVRFPK